jgi:hypothetical protein
MARTRIENGIEVTLTPEEEAQRDAEEKAWADEAPKRNAIKEIHRLESEITPRRLRDAYVDPTWINAQEAKIAKERSKL